MNPTPLHFCKLTYGSLKFLSPPPAEGANPMAPPGINDPSNHSTVRKKKTREIPNLSDCHGCGRRTNRSNPKDGLRILKSEWRIVLLCKCCYEFVQSGQFCAYCLTSVSKTPSFEVSCDDEGVVFYRCNRCNRRVHKECVSRYCYLAPFSYLPGVRNLDDGDFSVCIDCWLPSVLNHRSDGRMKARTRENVGLDSDTPLSISTGSDSGDQTQLPQDLANEGSGARKTVSSVNEVKLKAINKAKVAVRVEELSYAAIDLEANRTDNENGSGGNCCNEDSLVNHCDQELAMQLHRAINSSPRIAKGLALACEESAKVSELNGCALMRNGLEKSERNTSPMEQESIQVSSSKMMDGSCKDNCNVNVVSQSFQERCEASCSATKIDRYLRKYSRRRSGIQHSDHEVIHQNCNPNC